MNVHARIKARREALGLTMEELAARVGVSWQTVQQWERNTAPKRTRMPQVAVVLGTTPDYLLFGRGPVPTPPPEQLPLLPADPQARLSPLAVRVAELMDQRRDDELARTELWAHAMRLFGGVGLQERRDLLGAQDARRETARHDPDTNDEPPPPAGTPPERSRP